MTLKEISQKLLASTSHLALRVPQPEIPLEAKLKNRGLWASQLAEKFKERPQEGLLRGVIDLFVEYPEGVVSRVCNTMHGIPSKQDYFPTISELRKYLDDTAAELHKQQGKVSPTPRVAAAPPPPKEEEKPYYTGPIEDIRPGDILAYDRLEEYDAFMQSRHGIKPRHFGPNDQYVDSGARPFSNAPKPVDPNPFEGK